MTPQNPASHPRVAADALDRMVRDVRTGRAQWSHPHHIRTATDDLARAADAMAAGLAQLTAALAEARQPAPRSAAARPAPGADRTYAELHRAAASAAATADSLRRARRTMT